MINTCSCTINSKAPEHLHVTHPGVSPETTGTPTTSTAACVAAPRVRRARRAWVSTLTRVYSMSWTYPKHPPPFQRSSWSFKQSDSAHFKLTLTSSCTFPDSLKEQKQQLRGDRGARGRKTEYFPLSVINTEPGPCRCREV